MIEFLRKNGLRPNVEKDERYENNKSFILKGKRVYEPKNGLNKRFFQRELEEAETKFKKTFAEVIDEYIKHHVVSEEEDIYNTRNDDLLNIYCSAIDIYIKHKEHYFEEMEKAKEILFLLELTENLKYVKGFSGKDIVVFDLQRKNIGEWE